MRRLVLSCLLLSPSWGWAQQCNAPAVGQNCYARLGSPPAPYSLPDATAGNPIHTATGNKSHHDWDLFALPHRGGLSFQRYYSAQGMLLGTLGPQWQHGYEIHLTVPAAGRYRIRLPGEAAITLSEQPTAHGFIRAGQQPEEYLWHHPSGARYSFVNGVLQRLQQPNSDLLFEYYPDDSAWPAQLHRVRTRHGVLTMDYLEHGGHYYLRSLHSPIGTIQYHYEQVLESSFLRLSQVLYPDGRSLHYLYEAEHQQGHPFALTGLSIQHQPTGQHYRLRYWAYDQQGRAIYSAQEDRQQQVSIHYPTHHSDPIRIHSDTGEQQQFLNAQHQLIRTTGASCAGCPPPAFTLSTPAPNTVRINGLQLTQLKTGLRLHPPSAGWGQLWLDYNPTGQLLQWYSQLSGLTRWHYTLDGRPLRQEHANGDQLTLSQPSTTTQTLHYRSTSASSQTEVRWTHPTLLNITHPQESQILHFSPQGLLQQRRLSRPASAPNTDRYDYDAHGRLQHHYLPEGGQLEYVWADHHPQLLAVYWVDTQQHRTTLLHTLPGGYRHANGLLTQFTYTPSGQAHQLAVVSAQHAYYLQSRRYHPDSGLLLTEQQQFPLLHQQQHHDFGYNDQQQTVLVQSPTTSPQFFAWTEEGALWRSNHFHTPHISRDASGLPTAIEEAQQTLSLHYSPQRQLQHVQLHTQLLATYEHNAFGQLIAAHYADHSRSFVFNAHRLELEHRRTIASAVPYESRRYVYAHNVPIAMLRYRPEQVTELYTIHTDWLGTPHSMTDQHGTLVWAAHYTVFGQAQLLRNHIDLPLRLTGHYADPVTGWHHNGYRTYLPRYGHYLEPDPLGPIPGLQALGYAQQQPRHYADPTGLALFAFDGTRQNPLTESNIHFLSQLYDGDSFYQSGPGNPHYLDWDAITANQAHAIIQNQWAHLLNLIEQGQKSGQAALTIDIIGFSRGAALARHFANLILQHTQDGWFSYQHPQRGQLALCIQPRFMGLFDTVAQFGLSGSGNHLYDFSISPLWGWVAHAVALHEHRWWFPLHSLDVPANINRIEQAFIGAHTDIGGGHDLLDASTTDLSRVALMWMLWQARAVGVNFSDMTVDNTAPSPPILHDERSALERYLLNSDRRVLSPNHPAHNLYQAEHSELGQRLRHQVEAFLQRFSDWRTRDDNHVATVDMAAYYHWLMQQYAQAP